ncbi:glutathione S-transferase protein [Hyaloraphidium curvatum]|nr:glutathione S-transferase protein [Hyaloraphidium curvatum]
MPDGRLLLGNKRYSSWSMRGWLAVHLAGLDVEEAVIPFVRTDGAASTPDIKSRTPAGLVPYLEHKGVRVWESLSICEYCAEQKPGLWPANPAARAVARSISAEMATGFRGLRQNMWFNAGRDFAGLGRTPAALADIARVERIWEECLAEHGGPFLFGGSFGLADAMYAPVVGRFITWQPELSDTSRKYVAAVRAHPLVDRWYREALAEPESMLLASYETPPDA